MLECLIIIFYVRMSIEHDCLVGRPTPCFIPFRGSAGTVPGCSCVTRVASLRAPFIYSVKTPKFALPETPKNISIPASPQMRPHSVGTFPAQPAPSLAQPLLILAFLRDVSNQPSLAFLYSSFKPSHFKMLARLGWEGIFRGYSSKLRDRSRATQGVGSRIQWRYSEVYRPIRPCHVRDPLYSNINYKIIN